ncbi:head-tail adaptor [Mycobacterium phage Dori]|uniref:head-tail adaptor n=1 Tax=Mycobacterium phage Dori TaxID=1089121 RepID=UPI000232F497|nr:head-tail adaptor [Mycobacterium phage Dori]AER47670.1 hypothetical protein DORI_19 [Mycobacterium phage Dori]UVT31452.1 head-to-tail adaptor [Mycobacterium phage Sejanus]UVT31552.1 head-to-tail adaptor [Mycobacterium phage Mask]
MCGVSCEWPVDRSCLPALPPVGDDPDNPAPEYVEAVARRNDAENLAIHVLWALSGRQFGVCETSARPCPALFGSYGDWPAYVLAREDVGYWANWPCGCVGSCTVSGPRVVHLPGPVHEIVAVTIEGETLDMSDYQLEGDALYRKGGQWPRQELNRPLGEVNTWSVTYLRGTPVPPGVDRLTGVLAREFIAACDDDEESCRLPRTLVATTRRGVSHQFDPAKILAAGMTGLTEVDQWLASVNPHKLQQNPQVL